MVHALGWPGALATFASADELKVGEKAPDFKLPASDGKTYTLADFKGKEAVVLAWFPKAYTRGCTIECKSLAEHGDMIKKYNAKYFMISVDALEDNKGFAEQQHADFPLLADTAKKTAEAYGVLGQNGLANRWTFYVGADGKILDIDKKVNPANSGQDISARLKALNVPLAGK